MSNGQKGSWQREKCILINLHDCFVKYNICLHLSSIKTKPNPPPQKKKNSYLLTVKSLSRVAANQHIFKDGLTNKKICEIMRIKNDLEFQIGRYQSRATCFDIILTEASAEVWMSKHVARD